MARSKDVQAKRLFAQQRINSNARSRALQRLGKLHYDELRTLYAEEKAKLKEEWGPLPGDEES